MRKNKIVAVMLLVFVLALSFVLTACVTDEHQCTSKCPECGKCLNKECTQEACKEKCPGHEEKPEHVCGHKCPTCGKCTDTTCTDPVCADKCPGHEPTPPAHECTSKCPVCGKCTNKDCTEEACKDKCQGHHPDTCQHVCATCGGCYNETCTDPICATKCDCIPGLENAKEYVRTLYIDAKNESTSANYDLVDHVRVKEPHTGVMTDYTVTWTITVAEGATAPATVAKGEGKWTVTVSTDKFSEDQAYQLVATVTDSEGNILTTSFNRYVPAYKVLSYDEFVKAADDADVAVQGIVTGIISKTNGNTSNGLYLQSLDNKGGFYIYNMANDPVTDKIEVGMKVEAAGKKDTYNGTMEVVSATVTVLDQTPATVTPVDLTEAFKAASDLKATTLTYGQALLVKLTGVTILPQDDDTTNSGYYKFQLAGKTAYVRISSSACPLVKADQTTMIANHKAKAGYIADVVGLVTLYSGSFYLTPVSADAFSNFQLATLTGQEAIDAEKKLISFKNVEEDTIIDLIANGKNYTNVTITWAFKENTTHTTATIENGKLIVVLGDEPETITLVATFTEGDVTDTETYEFTVDAASTQEYIPEAVKEAKVGTFKFGLQQQNLDQFLYFDGEINSSEYLTTTTKASKAADVVVAAVDGGYTLKVGSKYIEVYKNSSNKYRVTLVDAATGKWTWNDDAKLFVYNVDGTDYFLGTYNNFNTISASAVSYISGDKAGNLDKTQFAARITKLIEADYKLNQIESATVGTYKFGLYQATLGKTLYFAGEINSSEYLTTTEKFSKAADVVVAAVDGGYTLKVGSKYIEVYKNSSNKYRVTLVDAATGKWTWNDDAKLFVYNVDGTDYFLGTYNNFNTISASAVSYISGDNAGNIGKTQFVAVMYNFELAEVEWQPIESAVAGTYKLGLYQVTLGKMLYFAGEINSSEYLTTTEKFSKAADVVVAAVDGGYTLKVGSKYIEVYKNSSNKYRVTLVDAATGKWTWNDDAKLFVYNVDGTDYFLGTYNNFNTISASAVSYISGDNAGNIGKTQFVAQLGVRGFKNTQPDPTPATDEEKVADAEKAIGTTLTISKAGETELYTSTEVTVTWAINGETTLATLAGNKLTVAALPTDADGTFTLTATIKSGEVEKTVDITVTVKKVVTTVNDGTAEKPYTVEEVLAVTANLAKDEYTESMIYVKGIVKSFEKGSYVKNLYLVDTTDSTVRFLVYSANFTETVKEIAVGDTIVVKGAVKNYNGTIEMTNVKNGDTVVHDFPTLISCVAGQGTIAVAEGSSDKATVTIANDQKTGENYTTFVFEVTVAEGYELVSVKVDGVVVTAEGGKYTGRIAGNTLIFVETKVAGAQLPTLAATLTFDKEKTSRTSFSTTEQIWEQNGIKFTHNKENGSNNIADYAAPIRCYQKHSAKVEYANMVKMVIKCGSADYAKALKTSIDSTATVTVSGSDVTVTFAAAVSEFSITFTAQVRINSIDVYTLA